MQIRRIFTPLGKSNFYLPNRAPDTMFDPVGASTVR